MNENGIMRDFIIQKFQQLYRKHWKAEGKTQLQFAMAIQKELPDAKVTNQYVHRWYKGTLRPGNKYLPAICKVLGVEISAFQPQTHTEYYRYSSAFADAMDIVLQEMAEKNFDIDLTFFQGLRCLVDFDNLFPVYRPLHYYGPEALNHKVYERSVPAKKAITENSKGLFEIIRPDTIFTMTKYDMKFIKEIQTKVRDLVLELFEERRKELKDAEDFVNYSFWVKNMLTVNPNYMNDHTLWETYVFSEEELQHYDQAGIYTEKEEKRFNLPRRGTPLVPQKDKKTED